MELNDLNLSHVSESLTRIEQLLCIINDFLRKQINANLIRKENMASNPN
jgi:hypothetical protein